MAVLLPITNFPGHLEVLSRYFKILPFTYNTIHECTEMGYAQFICDVTEHGMITLLRGSICRSVARLELAATIMPCNNIDGQYLY